MGAERVSGKEINKGMDEFGRIAVRSCSRVLWTATDARSIPASSHSVVPKSKLAIFSEDDGAEQEVIILLIFLCDAMILGMYAYVWFICMLLSSCTFQHKHTLASIYNLLFLFECFSLLRLGGPSRQQKGIQSRGF